MDTGPRPGKEPARRRWRAARILIVLLVLAAFAYAMVWAWSFTVSQLGSFAPLAAVLVALLVLAVSVPAVLLRYHQQLTHGAERVAQWLAAQAEHNPTLRRLAARHPRLVAFLQARLTPARPAGLGLTVWVIIALVLAWVVLSLMVDVATRQATLVGTDLRIANLAAALRVPADDPAMWVISYLGYDAALVVTAVVVAVLLLARRLREGLLLGLAVAGAFGSYVLLKALVQRPRPPLADARYLARDFSFPSGHATIAAAVGLGLAYLLAFRLLPRVRSLPGLLRDTLAIGAFAVAALLALAVGVARVYLGVHYPSDVLAGWALGALWATLLAVGLRFVPAQSHPHVSQGQPPARTHAPARRLRGWIAPLGGMALALVAVIGLAAAYRPLPQAPRVQAPAPLVVAPAAVPTIVQADLPHYTESLTGRREEPINIILVGTRAELEATFEAAGWYEAQPLTLAVLGEAVTASVSHHPDPHGPVTPDFLANEPETLAFSQPVGGTFAKRHHIRIWATNVVTVDGRTVWLATASYDEGFELAPTSFIPTHRIAPNIDTERDYDAADLARTGDVRREARVQLVPPELGDNFAGNPFFTYGQAAVLWLR